MMPNKSSDFVESFFLTTEFNMIYQRDYYGNGFPL